MSSSSPDPDADPAISSSAGREQHQQTIDHFDRLPDSVLLIIFNNIADVKSLGRCCFVSRRFHTLVSEVDNVVVRVDCVISGSDDSNNSQVADPRNSVSINKSNVRVGGMLANVARLLLGGIVRPIQALGQILWQRKAGSAAGVSDPSFSEVSHHSPREVLRNFKEIRRLRIELPSGESEVEDGVLLKWKADFGSTLHSCVILGASTVVPSSSSSASAVNTCKGSFEGILEIDDGEDNGSIPELFVTNGGLKLRVMWTISSLVAASARHYLLQPIIADHETLQSLDLTDADGLGVLCMNKEQLEESRVKPVSASLSSQRTIVPALHMSLWYAPHLELPGGLVLKGATLVAVQPSEHRKETAHLDIGWISGAFQEPYGTAARLLLKRRTYSLEMNSF